MTFSRLSSCLLILLNASRLFAADAPPMVATLHPLMTEMVGRIAGERVEVVELMPPTADPHSFDPKPAEFARIQSARMVVAMGKHLETYLDRLRENLPDDVVIFEAGRKVPSVRIDVTDEVFMCCPTHSQGAIDPHWWHSPVAMRRAVRDVGRALETVLPSERDDLRDRTRQVMDELESLHEWAQNQLSVIPSDHRKLVTAHAAFGYFCSEYGFQSIPVQGLNRERNPTPDYLAETVQILRREQIPAVFPEADANVRLLDTLRMETGVRMGTPLYADNIGHGRINYADLIRHNVNAVVMALAPQTEDATP